MCSDEWRRCCFPMRHRRWRQEGTITEMRLYRNADLVVLAGLVGKVGTDRRMRLPLKQLTWARR